MVQGLFLNPSDAFSSGSGGRIRKVGPELIPFDSDENGAFAGFDEDHAPVNIEDFAFEREIDLHADELSVLETADWAEVERESGETEDLNENERLDSSQREDAEAKETQVKLSFKAILPRKRRGRMIEEKYEIFSFGGAEPQEGETELQSDELAEASDTESGIETLLEEVDEKENIEDEGRFEKPIDADPANQTELGEEEPETVGKVAASGEERMADPGDEHVVSVESIVNGTAPQGSDVSEEELKPEAGKIYEAIESMDASAPEDSKRSEEEVEADGGQQGVETSEEVHADGVAAIMDGGIEMKKDSDNRDLRFGFEDKQARARIKVIGVGGAGSNAVDNMITSGLKGVEFIAVNTDMQALEPCLAGRKVQIGKELTKGLGSGGNPDIGRQSAEEDINSLRDLMDDSDMIFITAGFGGGTGTGAVPIMAKMALERGILTVGIVTKPFNFEGSRRTKHALKGLEELRASVDTLIVIPNDKLLAIIDEDMHFKEALLKADEVLYQGTKGISDIINTRGYINLDFADAKAVMQNSGEAIMGVGVGEGDRRAVEAAESAITSPLLDNLTIEGAQGILINITGSENMKMMEIQGAVDLVTKRAGTDADVFFGIVNDESMGDSISVTVIATGFDGGGRRGSGELRFPEPKFRSKDEGRAATKVKSVREVASMNGNGNDNGSEPGPRNGNGGIDHELSGDQLDFVNADDEGLLPDYLPDEFEINDRELPAFIRRSRRKHNR